MQRRKLPLFSAFFLIDFARNAADDRAAECAENRKDAAGRSANQCAFQGRGKSGSFGCGWLMEKGVSSLSENPAARCPAHVKTGCGL